jgi:DNA recombination protein RmuC
MTDILLVVLIILALVALVLLVVLLVRKDRSTADALAGLQRQLEQADAVVARVAEVTAAVARLDGLIRDEFARNREETQRTLRESREEQANSLTRFETTFTTNVKEINDLQRQKFDGFTKEQAVARETIDKQLAQMRETLSKEQTTSREAIDKQLTQVREVMERQLKSLQEDNSAKLEEMRKTVDEKLQESVEKRFNESFKLISDRLDMVHKGLGEMQTLANGVGDLKKVLTNVKTRGSLGEIQLGALLEQILSPEQYEHNAQTKKRSQQRVEYVIKLPGNDSDSDFVLLPIDSKFPIEDYQRLLEAYDGAGEEAIEVVSRSFEAAIKKSARDIRDKYINPPITTDFAILFVPTEGLYAEVLRRTGLFEQLQREFKIVVVGPANLAAFLSSLQMGFRTLAIEKRSSEVWGLLSAVKTEFGKFGDVVEGVKKKLGAATNDLDKIGTRTRVINQKLKTVQELPAEESIALLGESEDSIEVEVEVEVETDENEG